MNLCPHCGYPLQAGTSYCTNCGKKIVSEDNNTSINKMTSTIVSEGTERHSTPAATFSRKNSQRKIVNLWLVLTVVFLFLVFLPSLIGLDGMKGGYALSFVSGFMVIMSIIIVFIYRSRAKQLDKILSGEGLVAVWKYTTDEWINFTKADFEEEKKAKNFMFKLVSVIAIIIGIILWLLMKDILIFYISLGVIPLVAIPAWLAPRMRYKKLLRSEPEAIIAQNGLIVGKMFHLWVKLGARLDGVVLNNDEFPSLLEFSYSMPTRNGRQEEVARVPVPAGKNEEAARVAEYFNTLRK
ncbi:MAG: zinc ribbon domain-containing protein [Chitinophagaceae bacterium]